MNVFLTYIYVYDKQLHLHGKTENYHISEGDLVFF